MSSVKKTRLAFKVIGKNEAMAALMLYASKKRHLATPLEIDANEFIRIFGHPYEETVAEIWRWLDYFFPNKELFSSTDESYENYVKCTADKEPTKWVMDSFMVHKDEWVFRGYVYEVKGLYSDDQIKLLILEDFDKERRYFEKLKVKFNEAPNESLIYERPRIPESVRIEVWRRDGGKCARCGSREKLEYDHIVPISKGGSNTARNIELLCEKCNRSKSNNVV